MAASRALITDDGPHQLTGTTASLTGPHREDQVVLVNTHADDPSDPFQGTRARWRKISDADLSRSDTLMSLVERRGLERLIRDNPLRARRLSGLRPDRVGPDASERETGD